ncbi:MAG: hypothetical protein RJA49_1907 [Actinomycetota bacterium]
MDEEISDEELTALALAADPDAPLGDDAVPFDAQLTEFPELLPSWYMPAPSSYRRSRRRVAVVALIIISLLVINALGLCITSGHVEMPF